MTGESCGVTYRCNSDETVVFLTGFPSRVRYECLEQQLMLVWTWYSHKSGGKQRLHWTNFCQAWNYLPSFRALPQCDQYQIILLGDCDTSVNNIPTVAARQRDWIEPTSTWLQAVLFSWMSVRIIIIGLSCMRTRLELKWLKNN